MPADDDEPAVLLFTSGTTAAPKAALLRHRHLSSYISARSSSAAPDDDEAVLVSVPPYHVAGVANLLSNLYAGRRVVYLPQFDAEAWLDRSATDGITHAMVVPTMLARIVDALDARRRRPADAPTRLSYGGARTPSSVLLERAMRAVARRRAS